MIPADNVLQRVATGRPDPLFDLTTDQRDTIRAAVEGSTILIAGAAGSIGSSLLNALLVYEPSKIVAADINENGLAELMRSLRSSGSILPSTSVEPLLVDLTSPITLRIAKSFASFDTVLNLAAVKHVRSERDLLSVLRMLDVNVGGTRRLMDIATESSAQFFSVSTDKAANPSNLMGASKRLMELEMARQSECVVATCRFANVAFSAGSLLESWIKRAQMSQPIAVPTGISRYFMTTEEAATLCLLSAFCAPGHILTPSLSSATHLEPLTTLLPRVLAALGLEPVYIESEEEAVREAHKLAAQGRQVVILQPGDTTGEKQAEEFLVATEREVDLGITGVIATPLVCPTSPKSKTIALMDAAIASPEAAISIEDVADALAFDVPTLRWNQSAQSLDHRL